MNVKDYLVSQIAESQSTVQDFAKDEHVRAELLKLTEALIELYKAGNKLLLGGNGGSAADAQHIAGEIVSRFYFDRPGLPAIALTTDTSVMTAIGNDYGYEHLFSRQIEANGKPGDLFLGLSTSGNSPNVIQGLIKAKEMGLKTAGLTGQSGGQMNDLCDFIIRVPSTITPRIQECHIMACHAFCAALEENLFGASGK